MESVEKHDTKILAVAGKGGVGKTSIAANIVRLLVKNYPGSRILAIDADPAVCSVTAFPPISWKKMSSRQATTRQSPCTAMYTMAI